MQLCWIQQTVGEFPLKMNTVHIYLQYFMSKVTEASNMEAVEHLNKNDVSNNQSYAWGLL